MTDLSIIIPSRNDIYLSRTVNDIFVKATGDIEVIVVLDGATKYPLPASNSRLKYIKKPKSRGMRSAINDASIVAKGKYLLKTDSHCLFAEGFDEELIKDCDDDWVVIPRRYTFSSDSWERVPNTVVDYHYISCPWNNERMFVSICCPWISRTIEKGNTVLDDTMTFQGSVWMMSADHFRNQLHRLSEEGYGTFASEPQEISNKTWLGGGRVVVNKNTWYAHLKPGTASINRGYNLADVNMYQGLIYSAHYWAENEWEGRIHDFDWLIDKFWPLPMKDTLVHGEKYYWPENWREYYDGTLRIGSQVWV